MFKHTMRWLALLCAAALLTGAGLAEAIDAPGPARVAGAASYALAQALADRYGVALSEGAPLYAPAHPQPMNAFLVTAPDCQVGIDGDDMYPVGQTGLIPEITGYLEGWMGDIEAASGGAIRFVADPDDADVLVVARQDFKYYGLYSGGGRSAEGYACAVTLTARQLSVPENAASLSQTRIPGEAEVLHGGARFWKTPPLLAGTDALAGFADSILAWYGLGAARGDRGAGVKALQQALIDWGFLQDGADGSFGPKTEAALMLAQEAAGLEPTGAADRATLLALYYGD